MRTLGAALGGAVVAGIIMFAVGTHAARDPYAGGAIVGQPAPYAVPWWRSTQPYATAPGYAQPSLVSQPYAPMVTPGTVYVAPPAYVVSPAPAAATSATYAAPVRRVARPQVVRERVVTREPLEAQRAPERSWAKTALVIGGSSAAGAGVGAIAGGRKGALAGAALGGGVASIFEAVKRH